MISATQLFDLNKQRVPLLIESWQPILRLFNWRVRLSDVSPAKGHLMECAINRNRTIANIRIAEEAYFLANDQFDQLIVHELLHTLFDPIREEFDFILQSLPPERKEEYKLRHDREIEKVVEQLSICLYDLSTKPV